MDNEEEGELRNPFPSPPSHYTRYTSHNLNLLDILKENSPDLNNQTSVLHDQQDVPDWPLSQLQKPRVDWILEDENPHFNVFGDDWLIKEKVLSLQEHGINQLYPSDPTVDRRPALVSVLRSLLLTHSTLSTSLLVPPPSGQSEDPPEWVRNIEWLATLGQNLMAAANDLRPVQARANLELMMQQQLAHKREETAELHKRCDEWESKLTDLRRAALDIPLYKSLQVSLPNAEASSISNSSADVLHWAGEV